MTFTRPGASAVTAASVPKTLTKWAIMWSRVGRWRRRARAARGRTRASRRPRGRIARSGDPPRRTQALGSARGGRRWLQPARRRGRVRAAGDARGDRGRTTPGLDALGMRVGDLIRPDRVHGSLYTDPAMFVLELERIWYRTWVY